MYRVYEKVRYRAKVSRLSRFYVITDVTFSR